MMKNLIKTLTPIAIALLMAACGNETQQSEKEQESVAIKKSQESTPVPVIIQDEMVNAVYQHYINLSAALTKADVIEAKIAANAIETGSQRLSGGSKLVSAASKITASTDIEEQRAAYETISDEMMRMVKEAGVSQGEVFVQYCPMAFDDTGASWLSSTKEVRNPYMGDKMLACGVNKESIR